MVYLKLLPLDELKVDRAFIADLPSNPDDTILIRSAVDLGHNLGMKATTWAGRWRGTSWTTG